MHCVQSVCTATARDFREKKLINEAFFQSVHFVHFFYNFPIYRERIIIRDKYIYRESFGKKLHTLHKGLFLPKKTDK